MRANASKFINVQFFNGILALGLYLRELFGCAAFYNILNREKLFYIIIITKSPYKFMYSRESTHIIRKRPDL